MPLNLRGSQKFRNFNVPVSYRIHDRSGKFLDARNVYSVQDRLDTRFGTSRMNAEPLPGAIQSLSFFAKSDGSRYTLAMVDRELYVVNTNGPQSESINGFQFNGLPNLKHRGITWNDRHIIAVEGEARLYSFDGEIFTQLGQNPPPFAATLTAESGGTLTDGSKYKVGITFYSTQLGFESNVKESAEITIADPNKKIKADFNASAPSNLFMDKVRIYLKNVTTDSDYLFIAEVDTSVMTYSIADESTSAQTPPTKNGMPESGGGKYLTQFNSQLVFAGNSNYPNDVFFSEDDLPDAFNGLDDRLVLHISGHGAITGLAVGLFSDSVLDPFLVIFKRKSTRIFSNIGGQPKMVVLSEEIGCVSHDTIVVKNGVVYFLSEEGWRAIANGRLVVDKQGDAITLGNGDIDDIFKSSGYVYEVNRNGLGRTFSVYYPTLDQYITWVPEASNAAYTKAYVYEYDSAGFKPYEFAVPATCSVLGENSSGRDMVLFGTSDGFVMKHSIMEERSDRDQDNNIVPINAFAVLPWLPEDGDFDATYNYRELILKALASGAQLTVKTFLDYNLSTGIEGTYSFPDQNEGFILDESILDQGIFGDERSVVTARSDINRVGESIAIGFYQNEIGANIGLVSMQVDSSKNGNRNRPSDDDDGEGGFDADTGTYYPSVSESVQQAAEYAAQAAASAATASAVIPAGGEIGDFLERDTVDTATWMDGSFSGFSQRFNEMFESSGLKDTLDKILQITYAPPAITLSASPAQSVREKGTAVASVDLTANTTKFSEPITGVTFYRGGVLIHTAASPDPDPDGLVNETYTDGTGFSDVTTYTAKVTDGTTEVTSNTVTYNYVYPYYYGSGLPGLTAAQVAALTKSVITSSSNLNRIFNPSTGEVFYFAYPASYGALTSILDENGFETFADWTLRTENITGLDSTPISYRIYEFNNPVVAGTTDYTFIR
jgi:hypothetical protein